MFSIFVIAAGFAAYGPPTNQDAFEAFTARILVEVRESGDALREPELIFAPDFPLDVEIERCVPRAERAVRMETGAIVQYNGYDCIVEVWPNAQPPYRTSGFYRHTGFEWEYYGPIQEVYVPSPSQFAPNRGGGQMVTKPGAITYDGSPSNPINDGYDPYQALFDEYDRR
jgi:hypothetical protein